jgi:hypothetical protein
MVPEARGPAKKRGLFSTPFLPVQKKAAPRASIRFIPTTGHLGQQIVAPQREEMQTSEFAWIMRALPGPPPGGEAG